MIKGIDVSKYDVKMDWSKYTWDFAYIKVSEGTVIDPLFSYHWNGAKGYTYRGGYHFFRHYVDPKTSALSCAAFLGDDLGELPLWFDLEESGEGVAARAKSWLSWYEAITGVRPIIYTGLNILYELNLTSDISWMKNYKVALALYKYDNLSEATRKRIIHEVLTGQLPFIFPATPYPFSRMTSTQWTGKGDPADVPGYYMGVGSKRAVDINFYNGNAGEFKTEFNLGGLNDPIPPQDEPTKTPYILSIDGFSPVSGELESA